MEIKPAATLLLFSFAVPASHLVLAAAANSTADPADQTANITDTQLANSEPEALRLLSNLRFPSGQKIGYREQHMNPLLKTPREQSGKLWMEDDGALLMRVLSPRLEQRRLHAGRLSLQRPNRRLAGTMDEVLANTKTRSLKLNEKHAGHLVLLAVSHLLSGNSQALLEHFNLQVHSAAPRAAEPPHTTANWQIDLVPKSTRLRKNLNLIQLAGINDRITLLSTQRGNGAWSKMTFEPILEPTPS